MFPSHVRSPTNLTINNSWVSATLLSPCTHAVNHWALKSNEGASKGVQLLQYFARPIDSVIQAAAMLAFTFYDHFRDISYDIKSRNIGTVVGKSLLTPVTLSLKMLGAIAIATTFFFQGAIQLVIPYQTIYSVAKGKEAAQFYFYEYDRWSSQFADDSFRMKPTLFLKPVAMDDNNPLWKKRNEILNSIDESFRKRTGGHFGTSAYPEFANTYPEYDELCKNKESNEKLILAEASSGKKTDLGEKAGESLRKFTEIHYKVEDARNKWKSIDFISMDHEAVINDGVFLMFKADY